MITYGKNSVKELLLSASLELVEEILIASESGGFGEFVKLARQSGIKVSFLPRSVITKIAGTNQHQGVVARVSEFEYSTIEEILARAKNKDDKLLAVILDSIQDPQNLGAIIRTTNVLGGHGVIIPKDRASEVTPAVVKASAGAVHHIPVAKVTNLASTIRELKEKGIWIVGTDGRVDKSVFTLELGGLDLAVVIGSEGKGIRRLVKEECDFLVSIPVVGEVSSLNASVAAGIVIYEIIRQRAISR